MIVYLASAQNSLDQDTDLPLLTAALHGLGIDARVAAWDDPSVNWSDAGLTVVRSCWDYVPRREEFLTWARTVPRLHNPADLLAWNTDKTYLRDLAADGVRIIATQWNPAPGEVAEAAPSTTDSWVVKPSISAGAADTVRWSTPEQVDAHVAALRSAGRTAMVQPYLRGVETRGETALIYIDGEFAHAIRKGSLLPELDRGRVVGYDTEPITTRDPSAAELAFGTDLLDRITRRLGGAPLYARVDVVEAETVTLMELELTEPSLFLAHAPDSADRVAAAISARVGR